MLVKLDQLSYALSDTKDGDCQILTITLWEVAESAGAHVLAITDNLGELVNHAEKKIAEYAGRPHRLVVILGYEGEVTS